MSIEPIVEQVIEAMHAAPGAHRELGMLLATDHPTMPAADLLAAFEAAAVAIEKNFAHEGLPPQQAKLARTLARALSRDIGVLKRSGHRAPTCGDLGAYWTAGGGMFPAL